MDNSKVCLSASSDGVPSPTHVNKSEHGGKLPTLEPQEPIKVWDLWDFVMYWLLIYAKSCDLCCDSLGLAFCSTQLSIQALSLTSKSVVMQASMSYLGCRTRTPCEVVSPNFHALNDWVCMDWSKVFGTWDHVWTGPYLQPKLQFKPPLLLRICFLYSMLNHSGKYISFNDNLSGDSKNRHCLIK